MPPSRRKKPRDSSSRKQAQPVEFPAWRLRLFLSVDIEGSTAFKHGTTFLAETDIGKNKARDRQISESPGPPWLRALAEFYTGFDEEFSQAWKEGKSVPSGDTPTDDELFSGHPLFWKAAGDELLYVLELRDIRQAGFALDVLRVAIHRYRGRLRRYGRLDLKATAWIAGFPVNNMEIVLGPVPPSLADTPAWQASKDNRLFRLLLRHYSYEQSLAGESDERDMGVLDFIGPQMDLGFRLAKFASPRKFVISADLAYLLCSKVETYGKFENSAFESRAHRDIHYDGAHELKGILGGRPYPIFWIDSDYHNKVNEAYRHIESNATIEPIKIVEFWKNFVLGSGERWIIEPFISGIHLDAMEPHKEALRAYQIFFNSRIRQAQESAKKAEPGESRGEDIPQEILNNLQNYD